MRALIDTSVFLWMISDSERLSHSARMFLSNLGNDILISIASLWEIAIKTGLGKLELLQPFEELIPQQLKDNSVAILPIEIEHLKEIPSLPFHHRDPFDRLIIAQSLSEEMPVITSDAAFREYPVDVIW